MEEQDEEGAPTPPLEQRIGGVERRGLVDIVRQQDDTPAAAIASGGLSVCLLTNSRFLKIIDFFFKRALSKRQYSAKEI